MQTPESLQKKLIALEQRLFEPATRASPEQLDSLLADDFCEIAASGVQFGKSDALERVPNEPSPVIIALDFKVRLLTTGLAQVLYRAAMKKTYDTVYQYSMRTSLWQRRVGYWQMLFHQGTPTAAFEIPSSGDMQDD